MSKLIDAYTAGLMDGEGSIQINPCKASKGSKNKYWYLTIQLSSNNLEVLEFLKKHYKIGSITSWTSKQSTNRRISYNWRLYSSCGEKLLKKLIPYLKIKKNNALIALEFRKYTGFKSKQITKKISTKRFKLAMKIKKLNQRYGKGIGCRDFKDGDIK